MLDIFGPDSALLLARIQFAFTVSFHFIFPAFSIGLASYLAVLEGLWLRTGKQRLPRPVPLLAEDLRRRLRHGRRLGHRHVLPVRHQLGGLLRQGRAGDRPADGLRGADRLLPRGRVPRRHAVRHATASARGCTSPPTCMVALGTFVSAFWISVGEQLDADAGRLRDRRERPVPARQDWLDDHLQPELPLSPGRTR